MKGRKNKFFIKRIDRILAAVLILSLIAMPAEGWAASPEADADAAQAAAPEGMPELLDAEFQKESTAVSDDVVTNEIIVVYDDAGVSGKGQEKIQKQAEEALGDINAEVTQEVVEAGDQQGTVVVAEIPERLGVEEAIKQAEADEHISFAQPNYVYSALGEVKTWEEEPEEAARSEAAAGLEDTAEQESEESEEPEEAARSEAAAEPESTERPEAIAETEDIVEPEGDIETKAVTNDYIYNQGKRADYLDQAKIYDAWDIAKSQKRVTVAVLDSGCRLDHEDLQNNILKDYAYDSYYGRPLTASSVPYGGDPSGHGTHVCGLVAAEANNGIGVAGSSYNANVLPVKIFDNYGRSATTASFLRGLEYCRQLIEDGKINNLHVINMSVGYYSRSTISSGDTLLENMIGIMADYYNVLCVCAGGNGDGKSKPYVTAMYPSDFENCLSVTALDDNNFNCQWSDYNQAKDISAPGEGIISTHSLTRNYYAYSDGTSMSAPIVSGICALLWAQYPYLEVDEVVEAVEVTADSNAVKWQDNKTDKARRGETGSHGAIDAAEALKYISNKVVARGNRSIEKAEIKGISEFYQYTGGRIRPAVKVVMSGEPLKKNSDYLISYSNNINTGTATVTIEGIGLYKGTVVKNFSIGTKDIAQCSIALSGTNYAYTGSAINPAVTVRVSSQNSVKLRNGVDYTVSYANNVEPGTASVTIKAKNSNYTGNVVKKYTIAKANVKSLATRLSATAYTYNKKRRKPSVKITNGGLTLTKGRDYTVSYSKNIDVGKAVVKITGKGSHYTGTATHTFSINPKGTSLSKLSKKSKGFTAKWKKRTVQTSGYQIQYSTNKNFKKAKTKTVKNAKTTSASISRLKKKKIYYVRIRTYKKTGGKKYCSSWSKIKKVKTK